MTFGIINTVNCINQSSTRTDLSSLELLQLTGSSCQFNKCAVFSVVCEALLPTACNNTGRFVYIINDCKYLFSNGNEWTDGIVLPGLVFSWGCNVDGQLGDNSIVSRSSPVQVLGDFTDWCQVSAGVVHSIGTRQNGTAWAWGSNTNGRLGDNTAVSKSSPVSVVGDFTDWCQVSAGCHSVGLRTNGTAWAWGRNGTGAVGDNSIVAKSSPVQVVGDFTDWCQVSAGSDHSLGVRQSGTAWSWGCNGSGRLGDNTTVNRSSPVSIVGDFTDWCQVSAGNLHSLAVRQTGTAWAWGCNSIGQLGDNTVVSRLSPVQVVGGFTDWCQVSAGQTHTLGVRTNGTAWAWGAAGQGKVGDNTAVNKSSPVSVVGGFTDWCQVSASIRHSLGARQNGTAWAWGCNTNGQLGDDTITNKSSPVSVIGGFTDWRQVSAGAAHSLAIRTSSGV
jgi:alpha-tubulin suppressor-like RCC1 family protein